jgi:hypothetical protein
VNKYSSGPYALGSLLLAVGVVCFVALDTKIPAIVLLIAAALVFLRAQTTRRVP